ncbi:MAG: DUF2285 domain-containing protein [Methylocystaceae bacterium]|nr:MAG: DUF2285 domain-containing protein [Methylocystaceae bacterium]
MPELEPEVTDEPLWSEELTAYDEAHLITYLRLLDADAEGADWKEVSRIVLHRDPDADPSRSFHCWEGHLKRARWMTKCGYRQLLEGTRRID